MQPTPSSSRSKNASRNIVFGLTNRFFALLMPFIVRTVPCSMNLYLWYLLFLAKATVSYLLYGYKTAIPSALQRNDLISRIDTVVLMGRSFVQILFLLATDNFNFYLLASLFFTVLRNLLLSRLAERLYPQYICRGTISNTKFAELKQLVYGLLLSKIRGASRHAIDNICITAFLGFTMTELG